MNDVKSINPHLGAVEQSQTIAELKEITAKLGPLQDYARQAGWSLEQINDLGEARVIAMCKGGFILRGLEKAQGTRTDLTSFQTEKKLSPYAATISEAGLDSNQVYRWQVMSWAWNPENLVTPYCDKQRQDAKTITAEDVFRIGKRAMPHEIEEPEIIEGKYSVIIIDPPWPIQRIERDVSKDEAGWDYPVMSEEEIARLGTGDEHIVPNMMMDDCHVFLWTTQKYLPMAQRLFEKWSVKYVLEFVWHKPGGFQPYNLPQYNCEFALYGRKGAPEFIAATDFFCCFSAPRREHSRKPDEFYNTIRRVTAGKRIDVFARESRAGFDTWGNQAERFKED